MQALLPCWDLLPCGEDSRKRCPAYNDSTRPCWMIKGVDCVPQGNECRQCVVYRFGSLCTEDVKQLLNDVRGAERGEDDCLRRLLEKHLHKRSNGAAEENSCGE